MKTTIGRHAVTLATASTLVLGITGCNTITRLSEVGDGPELSKITNPVAQPDYRPVSLPMPAPVSPEDNPNSLWRPGAKVFFKDIRAKEVGDILTVRLTIDDKAELENKTERARDDGETQNIDTLLGLEAEFAKKLPQAINPGGELFSFSTDHETSGDGEIDRSESIDLTFAAVVTQVLPNGALAIMGRQEVRVNAELRELMVTGVIRPQDISTDNSITHERIAEMRVAYGGRGMLSELQQPRWGTQVWDIVFPF